ncbi:MAG: hypothetical protein HYU99_03310 [Deltaproteobacteria bacterium]|nr:hypothetical protein [Deltaproteobacteria bacterium]
MSDTGYEVNVLDGYRIVRKRIRLIAAVVFITTFSSVVWSLVLPKIYRSEALILVSGGLSGVGVTELLALQLSFGGGMTGGGGAGGKLVAFFHSRTMAERIITRFDLMKYYYKDAWDAEKNDWKAADPADKPSLQTAVVSFKQSASFSEDRKKGTVKISVEFTDPVLATQVANGIVDELQRFVDESEFTESKRKRVFIGNQLLANRRELLEAGKELSEYYQRNRISATLAQVDVPLEFSETERNIPTRLASSSDAVIPEQIRNLQETVKKMDAAAPKGEVVHGIPQQVYLEYVVQKREILKVLAGLLSQQYEMSKIEEARENISFEVLDKALVPEKRVKPQRRRIVMTAFVFSIFAALFLAFVLEYFQKIRPRQER